MSVWAKRRDPNVLVWEKVACLAKSRQENTHSFWQVQLSLRIQLKMGYHPYEQGRIIMILRMNNSSPDRGCMQPRESLELKTGKAMNPWLKRYRHHCAPMSSIRFGKQVILHSKQLLISGQPAGRYLLLDVWHGYPFEVDSKRMASNHIPSKPKKDKYQLTVSAQLWTAAAQLIVTCPNPHPYCRRMGEKKTTPNHKNPRRTIHLLEKVLDNPHILFRNRSIWTPTCSLRTSNFFKKPTKNAIYLFG